MVDDTNRHSTYSSIGKRTRRLAMKRNLSKNYKTMPEAPKILVMPAVFDGFSMAIVKKGFQGEVHI